MDRRDFLKLFALSAAGIYIPKRTYFDMGRFLPKLTPLTDQFKEASYRGQKFLLMENSNIDGGYMIPLDLAPVLDRFIKEQSVISSPFIVTMEKQENVGSKQWLENVKRLRNGS